MPDPTRPVAGAPIDTDWGQQVHDATFTPKGCRVSSGSAVSVGTSYAQCQLNNADDDPGGWLASDVLTVPAGAGGLYLIAMAATTSSGDEPYTTTVQLRANGGEVGRVTIQNDNSGVAYGQIVTIRDLAAGDVLAFYAKKSGGSNPSVFVRTASVIRVGSEFGA